MPIPAEYLLRIGIVTGKETGWEKGTRKKRCQVFFVLQCGKIYTLMNRKEYNIPDSPQVLKALRTGFDAVTRHIGLALFPLGLDFILWFAPHLRLKTQIESLVANLQTLSGMDSPQVEEFVQISTEMWTFLGERLNVLIALRSYPVGIFSLLSSILPLKNPLGTPLMVDLPSIWQAVGIMVVLLIAGIYIGSLYFAAVSQAALYDQIRWGQILKSWPWVGSQSLLISIFWLVIFGTFLGFTLCVVTAISLFSPSIGQVLLLFLGTVMIWILFPLFFSAHGIFIKKYPAWKSLITGIKLTNVTFIKTGMFILIAFLLTQGLGVLWQIPPEDSWLMVISIMGNAFVGTGMLAASFVYYQDMILWTEQMLALHRQHTDDEQLTEIS